MFFSKLTNLFLKAKIICPGLQDLQFVVPAATADGAHFHDSTHVCGDVYPGQDGAINLPDLPLSY